MRADIHTGQEHERSNHGPDTEAQDQSPPSPTSGLQHTAGPYSRAKTESRSACQLALSGQLGKQRLRLLQIERVEPFDEPAADWSEQFASLLPLPLVAPEAREVHRGAEFPGF